MKSREGQSDTKSVVGFILSRWAEGTQKGITSNVADTVLRVEPDSTSRGDNGRGGEKYVLKAEVELVDILQPEILPREGRLSETVDEISTRRGPTRSSS